MFKQILFGFLVISGLSTQSSIASQLNPVVDLDEVFKCSQQTQNGKGLNFSTLGTFEEHFMTTCSELEELYDGDVDILTLGDGYGRFSMRLLNECGSLKVFVNELSEANIGSLRQKLAQMKTSGTPDEKRKSERAHIVVGDCLELASNPNFTKLLKYNIPNHSFDAIMCSNLLHFFNGEGVLKAFINLYNFAKPGGQVYVFTNSRVRDLSCDQILKSGQMSYAMAKVIHDIVRFAGESDASLFPGLFHDQWLLKSPTLTEMLRTKPNGMGLNNFIPLRTLKLIADKLGFEVVSSKFYDICRFPLGNGTSCRDNVPEADDGDYVGLILKKPEGYTGKIITMENLDPDFVDACRTAEAKMKHFIETKLKFVKGYPFIELKKTVKKKVQNTTKKK